MKQDRPFRDIQTLKVHFTPGERYDKTLMRGGNKGTVKDRREGKKRGAQQVKMENLKQFNPESIFFIIFEFIIKICKP